MTIDRGAKRLCRLLVPCLAIGLALAACGSDDDPSAATTTAPADDACADAEDLRTSIAGLQDVDISEEGTNGLEAAVSAVQADLTALGESASAELEPEVDAVRGSLQELETAVTNLGSEGASQVLEAVAAVATSSSELLAALGDGACD
jgi:hypothetical protein